MTRDGRTTSVICTRASARRRSRFDAVRRARSTEVPRRSPTLIWLGRLYLEQGKPDEAEPFFERAAQLPPRNVAVLAGLGQAALAQTRLPARSHRCSRKRWPSILAPPASTRRWRTRIEGWATRRKAEAHLKLWRNTEISSCPIGCERISTMSLESGLSYELRGVRALEARDFKAAEEFFRKGVELTPATTALGRSLRHKLGTALVLQGDMAGAMARFEEVARLAPAEGLDEASAKANYSLGVVMAARESLNQAMQRLTAAVKYNPNYAEALMALGDTLRRSGRVRSVTEAIRRRGPHQPEVHRGAVRLCVGVGSSPPVSRGEGLARGERSRAARSPRAVARAGAVLAAAPDDTVRDGARAMALVQELMKGDQTTVARRDDGDGDWRSSDRFRRRRRHPERRHGRGADRAGRGPGRSPDDRQPASATSAARRAACRGPTTIRRIFPRCLPRRPRLVRQRGKVDPHITTELIDKIRYSTKMSGAVAASLPVGRCTVRPMNGCARRATQVDSDIYVL